MFTIKPFHSYAANQRNKKSVHKKTAVNMISSNQTRPTPYNELFCNVIRKTAGLSRCQADRKFCSLSFTGSTCVIHKTKPQKICPFSSKMNLINSLITLIIHYLHGRKATDTRVIKRGPDQAEAGGIHCDRYQSSRVKGSPLFPFSGLTSKLW